MSPAEQTYITAIEAVRQNPSSPEAHNQLGIVLFRLGRLDEAAGSFRRSIHLRPDLPEALNNLGQLLWRQGKSQDAIESMRLAVAARPQYTEAIFNLGNALYSSRYPREAAACFQRLTSLMPHSAEAWSNYASALLAADEVEQAVEAARKSVELGPDQAAAYYNLGNCLRRAHLRNEAEDAYRRCIAIDPKLGVAYGSLAICLTELGRIEEAMPLYQTAMGLTNESWVAESYAYMLYYTPGATPARILAEHRRWNDRYVKPLATRPHFANSRDPDRKLRVGYVSAYFYSHCLSFFKMPLFEHHDPSQVEVYCYSNSDYEDGITERLRKQAAVWRNVVRLDDAQLAQQIRDDRIDVLIDCSMHMLNHRLFAFALRAAPVQACWVAYPGTTGLAEMDYRISDPYLDPPGSDAAHSEKTVRLPHSYWCYDPLTTTEPSIGELPALSRGHITFGCLNNFLKVNSLTLEVWSRVLHALPTSRLVLLTEPGRARDRIRDRFVSLGVAAHRLDLIDRMPRQAYLECYNRFDISIDTFPYNGHTTTLDSLFMGVPPLTATGDTSVSRAGLCFLSNLGLAHLAARDLQSLPEKAVEIASDLPRLAELRASLRQRMRQSPLMDGTRFARDMESAYRLMWRNWCGRAS